MARNMIQANTALFSVLEQFCAARADPVMTPGAPRYVTSDRTSKRHLQYLRIGACLRFGHHRSLTHLTLGTEEYVGVIGFDFETQLPQFLPGAGNAGTVTCLLSEVRPQRMVSAAEVGNVVEVGSMHETGYSGHDIAAVSSVFPSVQVLRLVSPADEDAVWRLFLLLCAEEAQNGGSWIEGPLAGSIATLTDLNVPSLPYSAISRSMFDSDPRSLYMALYRCIEATYAYDASRRLSDRLGLGTPWQDVAAALDAEIGWHPQEASALRSILKNTVEADLKALCECLRAPSGEDLQTTAGRAIYGLRNRIVHFRPGSLPVDVEEINWNQLCTLLVGVVFDVFSHAYV
jgi:hypothetical protein